MKLINIGFGNMVSANRLVAIVSPESAPIKRVILDAKDRGSLILSLIHIFLLRLRHGSVGGGSYEE